MKELFQRRSRPGTELGGARLTLGAFGKHPGWDDHILGIGVETETLAQLKQTLYVSGIGAQVDSGAWEKLEPEKRLPGFDHTFLASRPGHVLLGQMWSSTDRKGRAKYPMVICIDGEAVSAGFMLEHLLAGLERLRGACQATTSSAQVAEDCRVGQEQLRAVLGREPASLAQAGLALDVRRRFLEQPQFGPDRLGFLRVLHELNVGPVGAGGRAPAGASSHTARPRHLRVPLAGTAPKDGLLLWSTLLRCIIPEPIPLLLLARAKEDWLDVLINEPAPDDFFCLGAALKALPLATEVPYHLAPDLKQSWAEIEARFLGAKTSIFPAAIPAQSGGPPPLAPPPIAAPRLAPRGTGAAAGPAPAPRLGPTPKRRISRLLLLGILVLLLLLALAVLWVLFGLRRSAGSGASTPKGPASTGQTGTPSAAARPSAGAAQTEQAYQMALLAAQDSGKRKDYSNALVQASQALEAKPGDPTASKLLEELKQAGLAASQQEQQYQAATNAAALAMLQMNYGDASNQAAVAMVIKPNDTAALKLMTDATHAIESTGSHMQQQYQAATNRAAQALAEGKFLEATNQAAIAAALKPGDPVAAKLQSDALAAARQEQKFENATNAANLALTQGRYQEATNQAAVALSIRTNHPLALQLQSRALEALDLQSAQHYLEQADYTRAAQVCQKHSGADAFKSVSAQVTLEQTALNEARLSLTNGDYSFMAALKGQAFGAKTPFATLMEHAAREKALLDALQILKQTNTVQDLKRRLAGPELSTLLTKPPFAELRAWADSQPNAAPAAETNDQALRRLDTDLEVLLVRFGVFKPTAREIESDKARQTKPLPGGALDDPQPYLDQVSQLEAAYVKGGWLDQGNRRKNLGKLRDAINYR